MVVARLSRCQLMRSKPIVLLAFQISTARSRRPFAHSRSLSRQMASAVCHSSASTTTLWSAAMAGRASWSKTKPGTESEKSRHLPSSPAYTPSGW
jgi:hypothetical protein